jgi:hypothetical protein
LKQNEMGSDCLPRGSNKIAAGIFAHSLCMNEAPGPWECRRGDCAGALNGRSMRQGAFAAVKAGIS